jgi:GTPase SAR1 family protein
LINFETQFLFVRVSQSLLESIKAIYSHLKPLSPDKIMPTVGLNSAQINYSFSFFFFLFVADFSLFSVGRLETNSSKLVFWDLGGQVGLRSIWDKYYEECQAIIYVVDSADIARIDEAKATLGKCLYSCFCLSTSVLIGGREKKKKEEPTTEPAVPQIFCRFPVRASRLERSSVVAACKQKGFTPSKKRKGN